MPLPKPRLTFAIGITGHRLERLGGTDLDRIEARLRAVFEEVEAACHGERRQHADRYAEGEPVLTLVSGLADGADQIAVLARPSGWRTVALLPKAEDAYLAALMEPASSGGAEKAEATARFKVALAQADSVAHLSEDEPASSQQAYDRAGQLMLRQIDLLVAVWDGIDDGRPGGTSALVRLALEWRIPVVRVSPGDNVPSAVITQMGDVGATPPDSGKEALGALVKRQFDPDEGLARHAGKQRSAAERLDGFLAERPPRRCLWPFYRWLLQVPRVRLWRLSLPLADEAQVRARWMPYLNALPSGDQRGRLDAILLPRVAAADALAIWYAHAYRSAYILAYLLSVAAVAVALFGLALPREGKSVEALLHGKAPLVAIEFGLILAIIAMVGWGRRRQWHERWLDYRALAEALRHLRILAPLGQYEPTALAIAAARPGAGWTVWYLRATMRELGLPDGDLNAAYQRSVLTAVRDSELAEQLAFHTENARALRHLHHGLHRTGDACFVVTASLLALFLILISIDAVLGTGPVSDRHVPRVLFAAIPWLGFTVTVLPTLGAAVSGIRFTGDFDGYAQRSAETEAGLSALRQVFATETIAPRFDRSTSLLREAARIMANDLSGWRALYGRKHLTLPA